jgi:hypothetical protein
MITLLYDVHQDDDLVTVTAVVEDMALVYPSTRFDPEEYGPALCKTSFYLSEDEELPSVEDDLIEYLEKMNLDWEIVPDNY